MARSHRHSAQKGASHGPNSSRGRWLVALSRGESGTVTVALCTVGWRGPGRAGSGGEGLWNAEGAPHRPCPQKSASVRPAGLPRRSGRQGCIERLRRRRRAPGGRGLDTGMKGWREEKARSSSPARRARLGKYERPREEYLHGLSEASSKRQSGREKAVDRVGWGTQEGLDEEQALKAGRPQVLAGSSGPARRECPAPGWPSRPAVALA